MPLDLNDIRKALENIVYTSSLASGSVSLDDGDFVTVTLTTTTTGKIMGVADISIYLGSVVAANEIPFGSNIAGEDWQIVFNNNNWGSTNNTNSVQKVYIRNISAGNGSLVLIRAFVRTITNSLSNVQI